VAVCISTPGLFRIWLKSLPPPSKAKILLAQGESNDNFCSCIRQHRSIYLAIWLEIHMNWYDFYLVCPDD
jgi:hypothetical protein